MIQITKAQFKLLKELVQDADPCSRDYNSSNGGYYYRCCDMDSRYEHADDCPKTAWNKLDLFLTTLEPE